MLIVLGSTCFAKRYGDGHALGNPSHGTGDGKVLSEDERKLLVGNTAALIAQFEAEHRRMLEQHASRMAEMKSRFETRSQAIRAFSPPMPRQASAPAMPWGWVKPMSSMAYFKLHDGTAWIRVQHHNASQMLMPWPSFEGWDECLPASIGTPIEELGGVLVKDIATAIAYLRKQCSVEKIGVWREIVKYM